MYCISKTCLTFDLLNYMIYFTLYVVWIMFGFVLSRQWSQTNTTIGTASWFSGLHQRQIHQCKPHNHFPMRWWFWNIKWWLLLLYNVFFNSCSRTKGPFIFYLLEPQDGGPVAVGADASSSYSGWFSVASSPGKMLVHSRFRPRTHQEQS